jgi:hypothetical protein
VLLAAFALVLFAARVKLYFSCCSGSDVINLSWRCDCSTPLELATRQDTTDSSVDIVVVSG